MFIFRFFHTDNVYLLVMLIIRFYSDTIHITLGFDMDDFADAYKY